MSSAVLRGDGRRLSPARYAALSLALLGLLAAYLVATVRTAAAAEVVVSQGKPTTASSVEWEGTPASAATDGNTGTRWSSAFAAAQWLQVDLGATTAVSSVKLNWEAAYATAFTVQFSTNGTTFTNATGTLRGNAGEQTITVAGNTRY